MWAACKLPLERDCARLEAASESQVEILLAASALKKSEKYCTSLFLLAAEEYVRYLFLNPSEEA